MKEQENLAKYTIINKSYDGIVITGFTIENDEGKKKLVNLHDMLKLARVGKLKNANAVLDTTTGEYILKIENSLSSLPILEKNEDSKLTIICRIIDSNNKCIGYKARDGNGKAYKLSIQKTWELIQNDMIKGLKATLVESYKIIYSEDLDLKQLPKIQV